MRLEQIEITDFGSYQQANIDLRDISSAVIMGQNGAGKSTAFVDAVLWALFGRCRTATDAMLRIGSTEMGVNLTFRLNGQTYRVLRKRSVKTKAGKSDLELQIEQDGTWIPMSGARLADTQQKILDLLNADYDLLTSTGFLLQGQADRFSRATSAERKAILSAILRFDQYGELKQAANKAASVEQGLKAGMAGNLTVLEQTANRLSDLLTALTDISDRRDAHASLTELLEIQRADMAEKIAQRKAELSSMAAVLESIKTHEMDLAKAVDRKDTAKKRLERLQSILNNASTIRQKQAEEKKAQDSLAELVSTEHALSTALTGVDAQIQASQATMQAIGELDSLIVKTESDVRVAVTAYQQVTREMEQGLERDRESAKLLGQVPCTPDLQQRCQFTIKAMQAKQRISQTEMHLSKRHASAPEQYLTIAQEVAPELMAKIQEAKQKKQDMDANGVSAHLERLSKERSAKGVDRRNAQDDIRTLHLSLSELQKFTKLVPELELAEGELPSATAEMQESMERISSIQSALTDLRAKASSRSSLESALVNDQEALNLLDVKRQTEQKAMNAVMVEIGQTEQQIHEAKRAQEALRPLQHEAAIHDRNLIHYQTLSDAYTLIPVLILENSIPILEQETNTILSKVSSSGMRVRLDTQKTLKSRDGLAETLEIIVRDVHGERPYENYSGGEKFRLDLSLRIGLAKLLANRAGARMETLIIDEGLGSLDEDGLAHLRDCLAALGKEFSLCLVITHVESMKNTFPSQILVTKNGHGSEVEVMR